MPTIFIKNTAELNNLVINGLIKGLLTYLSEKIVTIMQKNLLESEISTRTLRKSVSYSINNLNTESIISIDYELAQTFATPPKFGPTGLLEWGHLTTTFGTQALSQTWNGELVSFRLAEWLESGGSGDIGNQPIRASHWFSKTVDEVKSKLNSWCSAYLKKIYK